MVCNKIISKSKIKHLSSTKYLVTLKPHLQHKVTKHVLLKTQKDIWYLKLLREYPFFKIT